MSVMEMDMEEPRDERGHSRFAAEAEDVVITLPEDMEDDDNDELDERDDRER